MTGTAALIQDSAFWAAVLSLAAPLVFGVMGALVCARAGNLNFSIEGIFLMGALLGLLGAQHGLGPGTALVAAACIGAIAGLLYAVLIGPFGASPSLAGLALTLVGACVAQAGWLPAAAPRPLDMPALSGLPYAGEVLRQAPIFPLALLLAVIVAYGLNRTPMGLAIRACGDNPVAVEVKGRSVVGVRIGAIVSGSAIMAMGGAALVLTMPDLAFERLAGRGFLCLALAAAAGWRPGLGFALALLFGAIDAAAPHIQESAGVSAPLTAMVPYLLAMVLLAATRRRLRWPAALGVPYVKRRAL